MLRADLSKDPTNYWTHLALAMALFSANEAQEAVPHFRAVLAATAVNQETAIRYRAACCFEDAVRIAWPGGASTRRCAFVG